MPITNKDNYPLDWPAIAAEVKAANRYQCQECDVQCTRPGEPYAGARFVLTVAHYDQEYEAGEIFVAALCGPCHLRHDASYGNVNRRRAERYRQRQAGQMALDL